MSREYKGRQFLEISAGAIVADQPLACDVFLYLPLNGRMLLVRGAGQALDAATLALYQAKGHAKFFILDPLKNQGAYEAPAGDLPFNPDLPTEIKSVLPPTSAVGSVAAGAGARAGEASGEVITGAERPHAEGEILASPVRAEESLGKVLPFKKTSAEGTGEILTSSGGTVSEGSDAGAEERGNSAAGVEEGASAVRGENSSGASSDSAQEISAEGETKNLTEGEAAGQEGSAPEEILLEGAGSKGSTESDEPRTTGDRDSLSGEKASSSESSEELEAGELSAASREKSDAESPAANAESDASDVVGKRKRKKIDSLDGEEARTEAEGSGERRRRKGEESEAGTVRAVAGSGDEEEEEKKFGADEEALEEQSFEGGEDGEEEEASFSPAEAVKDAMRVVKGEAEPVDDSSKKISHEIGDLEEELVEFAPENQEFLDDVRKIAKGEEEGPGRWQLKLQDDAPQLQGLAKEDKAAAKLAHTLGKGLGLMRRELSQNSRVVTPVTEEEGRAQAERRGELEEKIKSLESTALILETLDDKDIELGDVPGMKGKSKLELLGQLEGELKKLRGSALLSEEDACLLDGKIKKVKAKDFDLHGEGVERVKEILEERKRSQAEVPLGEPEKIALNEAVTKEVRAAKISAKVTQELSASRRKLTELLDEKPKTKAERKANEAKAMALQEEIRELEALSFAVEAGEALTPEQAKRFDVPITSEFKLETAEDLARVSENLAKLKDEVVQSKLAAAEVESALMAKINGEEHPAGQETAVPADATSLPNQAIPVETSPAGTLASAQVETLGKLQAHLEEQTKEIGVAVDPSPEQLQKLRTKVNGEVGRALSGMKIEAKIVQLRQQMQRLVQEKTETPEARTTQEKQALELMDEIEGLEQMSDRLAEGENITPADLGEFLVIPKDYELNAGEPVAPTLNRWNESVGALKQDAQQSQRESQQSQTMLTRAILDSDHDALKERSINTRGLDRAKHSVSRLLKEFIETGKDIDPQAVWQIKHVVATEVRKTQAGINIAKKVTALAKRVEELSRIEGGSEEERRENAAEIKRQQGEIMRLQSLGEALDRGENLEEKIIKPFTEDLPEVFTFSTDQPSVETLTKVVDALGALKDEFFSVKKDALSTMKELKNTIKAQGEELPSSSMVSEGSLDDEVELRRLVSSPDGKMAQAGVYANAIFRAFGYQTAEAERDLMLASYLWNYSEDEVAQGFPGKVALLHRAARNPEKSTEMMLEDMAQAVRLACRYLDTPGVVTGKFSVDAKVFSNFCRQQAKETDPQLLERARQGAQQPLPEKERSRLIYLAREVGQSFDKWKGSRAMRG